MKTVLKAAAVAAVLMAAQPVFAGDYKHEGKHYSKEHMKAKHYNNTHDYNRDGRVDRHDRDAMNRDKRYNSSTYSSRFNVAPDRQTTYWGYPVQSTRNPGEVRDEMRLVKKR